MFPLYGFPGFGAPGYFTEVDMINVIMHGCNGTMGRVVCHHIHTESELEIVAGIDILLRTATFPVFQNIADCDMPADVIIDFSTAQAVPELMEYAVSKRIPLVCCTTGLDNCSIRRLIEISEVIPVFLSANMSLGINLLAEIAKISAKLLANAGFDIEIIERHHSKKIDAPSGTAFLLGREIQGVLDDGYEFITDRSGERKPRDVKEIGIHSIRGGTIVGDHTVVFAGSDEVIELKHHAASKDVFAKGAIVAAKFLVGKPPGKYSMVDLINANAT
jgi:4-hydroxy-tetrahydrodipicolinate reductase